MHDRVRKDTQVLLAGEGAGEKKRSKAQDLGVRIIDEPTFQAWLEHGPRNA